MNAAIISESPDSKRTLQVFPADYPFTEFAIEMDRQTWGMQPTYHSIKIIATREQVELFHKHLTQILDQTKPFNP